MTSDETLGHVESIYITHVAGESMVEVRQIMALAGIGLQGDRYANGRGAWSKAKPLKIRHVTLIESEAIEEVNAIHGTDFKPEDTRRNILTRGIRLNDLVDITFQVGSATMRGLELADPCARPSKLSGKPGFEAIFAQRGGLRAQVMQSGELQPGDTIEIHK